MKKKFVAIGHVDTGKSALCGHLLYKCGYVDEREMDKIRVKAQQDGMEKWVWSRVLDIYEEEQLRGKTHQYATVEFKFGDKSYELIDTPGHKSFVRSMIEGISNAHVNIAVLLVSMLENEFESSFERGMLKEHLLLTKAVGIEHIVVLANKMDAIDWSEKLCKDKIKTITKYLVGDLQWDRSKLSVVPISAFQGVGLLDTKGCPDWYKGKSFIETLDSIPDVVPISNECLAPKLPPPTNRPTNRYTVDISVLNTGGLAITVGYNCIMHYDGNECEIVIEKIQGKTKVTDTVVLRNGSPQTKCVVQLMLTTEAIAANTRLIFRKDDYTVGYGTIIKALSTRA